MLPVKYPYRSRWNPILASLLPDFDAVNLIINDGKVKYPLLCARRLDPDAPLAATPVLGAVPLANGNEKRSAGIEALRAAYAGDGDPLAARRLLVVTTPAGEVLTTMGALKAFTDSVVGVEAALTPTALVDNGLPSGYVGAQSVSQLDVVPLATIPPLPTPLGIGYTYRWYAPSGDSYTFSGLSAHPGTNRQPGIVMATGQPANVNPALYVEHIQAALEAYCNSTVMRALLADLSANRGPGQLQITIATNATSVAYVDGGGLVEFPISSRSSAARWSLDAVAAPRITSAKYVPMYGANAKRLHSVSLELRDGATFTAYYLEGLADPVRQPYLGNAAYASRNHYRVCLGKSSESIYQNAERERTPLEVLLGAEVIANSADSIAAMAQGFSSVAATEFFLLQDPLNASGVVITRPTIAMLTPGAAVVGDGSDVELRCDGSMFFFAGDDRKDKLANVVRMLPSSGLSASQQDDYDAARASLDAYAGQTNFFVVYPRTGMPTAKAQGWMDEASVAILRATRGDDRFFESYVRPDDSSATSVSWGEVKTLTAKWLSNSAPLIGHVVYLPPDERDQAPSDTFVLTPHRQEYLNALGTHPLVYVSDAELWLSNGAVNVERRAHGIELGSASESGALLELIRDLVAAGARFASPLRDLIALLLTANKDEGDPTWSSEQLLIEAGVLARVYTLADVLGGVISPNGVRDGGPAALMDAVSRGARHLLLDAAVERSTSLASIFHLTGAAALYGVPIVFTKEE